MLHGSFAARPPTSSAAKGCKRIEGDQEVMRRKRFDPKARGIDCAVKRDNVIGARDQRTTSGPRASCPTSTGRSHDRPHDQTQCRKITLDKRAPSRHVKALSTFNAISFQQGPTESFAL